MNQEKGLTGLRTLRKACNYKLSDLAGQVGVTPEHLSRVESGRANCSMSLMRGICDTLGCTPTELTDSIQDWRIKEISINIHKRQIRELESKMNAFEDLI